MTIEELVPELNLEDNRNEFKGIIEEGKSEKTGQEAGDSGHDVYTGPYIYTPDVPFTPRP